MTTMDPSAPTLSARQQEGAVQPAIGPACLVAGPLLALAGMALHDHGSDGDVALFTSVEGHLDRWLAAHLLLALGWAVLAVGLAAVLRLARGRGAVLTALGATVAVLGAAVSAFDDAAHGVLTYALGGHVPATTAIQIESGYFTHPVIAVLSAGVLVLPAGIALLGIALLRSRVVPVWGAVLLVLSPIPIQLADASGPAALAAGVPLLMGLATVARAAFRA